MEVNESVEKFKNIESYLNQMEVVLFNEDKEPHAALKEVGIFYGKVSSDFRDLENYFGIYEDQGSLVEIYFKNKKDLLQKNVNFIKIVLNSVVWPIRRFFKKWRLIKRR